MFSAAILLSPLPCFGQQRFTHRTCGDDLPRQHLSYLLGQHIANPVAGPVPKVPELVPGAAPGWLSKEGTHLLPGKNSFYQVRPSAGSQGLVHDHAWEREGYIGGGVRGVCVCARTRKLFFLFTLLVFKNFRCW